YNQNEAAKRVQPRAPAKAAPTQPATTAALDPQTRPAKPQARPADPQTPPTDPLARPADPPPTPADPQARPPATGGATLDKAPAAWQWRIMRKSWTGRDGKGFEELVQRIGESGCRNMHACLVGAQSNPLFRASNPVGMHFYADCADLPYMLRAYYAWKNGLPFSYSTAVTPLGHSRDIRYTARGNAITSRRDLVDADVDVRKAIPQVVDTISSAHYRYPPSYPGKLLPDHYPVRIGRD